LLPSPIGDLAFDWKQLEPASVFLMRLIDFSCAILLFDFATPEQAMFPNALS
jgi:hypothetical protein